MHNVAFLHRLRHENARTKGRHFDGDLVGVKLKYGIASIHGVALILDPTRYGRFDD